MVNKCLGAQHTPSLPENPTSDYSQGCPLAIQHCGAGREASCRYHVTISVDASHGWAGTMLYVWYWSHQQVGSYPTWVRKWIQTETTSRLGQIPPPVEKRIFWCLITCPIAHQNNWREQNSQPPSTILLPSSTGNHDIHHPTTCHTHNVLVEHPNSPAALSSDHTVHLSYSSPDNSPRTSKAISHATHPINGRPLPHQHIRTSLADCKPVAFPLSNDVRSSPSDNHECRHLVPVDSIGHSPKAVSILPPAVITQSPIQYKVEN